MKSMKRGHVAPALILEAAAMWAKPYSGAREYLTSWQELGTDRALALR